MNEEIFNKQELEENDKKKLQLIELVRSNKTLALLGAGCSVSLGYPKWSSLLTELESLTGGTFTKDQKKKEDSPLEYADEIKEHIAKCNSGQVDKYHAKLQQIFSPRNKRYDELHLLLLKLNFKGIVTTNYDIAIEAALTSINGSVNEPIQIKTDSKQLLSEFFLSLDFDDFPKRILHLHGIYANPENIILTASDYKKTYGFPILNKTEEIDKQKIEWSSHRKILWALLSTRRIIFVGFSFEDPYFITMLNLIAWDLWRWDSPIHYVILPIYAANSEKIKEKAVMLKKEYGIEAVFYIDHDGTHSELNNTIKEIANACGVTSSSDWINEANRRLK